VKDPKNSIKKFLDLISMFRKITGYKINTQKPVAFLYTNNEWLKKEIRKTVLFTIASEN
jgi:hypothetical protein